MAAWAWNFQTRKLKSDDSSMISVMPITLDRQLSWLMGTGS